LGGRGRKFGVEVKQTAEAVGGTLDFGEHVIERPPHERFVYITACFSRSADFPVSCVITTLRPCSKVHDVSRLAKDLPPDSIPVGGLRMVGNRTTPCVKLGG
jgi:hypothetical protein